MQQPFRLLKNGDQAFARMLAAIESARKTVRLEMYIYRDCPLGVRVREALVRAQRRGAQVRVMIDAWGSYALPDAFWDELVRAGGEFRRFNPIRLNRCFFRDHRKLLVCDSEAAFLGGFNIATEYCGDGVTGGWCDLGVEVTGGMVEALAEAFDRFFYRSDLPHYFMRLRRARQNRRVALPEGELLLSGPGWARNHMRRVLQEDFSAARNVQLIAAYFLPSRRIRVQLARAARRGGKVQLLLAGRSDVPISQLASRSLYHRLLRAGVEIYEYLPQVLHAKMFLMDDTVYLGSANLDTRSLQINYELMLRIRNPRFAAEARHCFYEFLAHARRIEPATWRRSRTFWGKLKERWAYFLLARVDPFIAQHQLRSLR